MKILLFVVLALPQYVFADYLTQTTNIQPNIAHGKKHYELCANCHMQDGSGKNGSFPALTAQHARVVIKQLDDINNKKRNNPTMFPFSSLQEIGGTQALVDVAYYIESMPTSVDTGKGSGNNLELGGRLYQQHCAACHQKNGDGSATLLYPRLNNQHYHYVLRQLQWIKSGYRKIDNQAMLKIVKQLTNEELKIIADYVSRLKKI